MFHKALLSVLLYITSVLGEYPTPEFDITPSLIGRTIYIEYAVTGFSGMWLGNDLEFNGTLYSVRNEHVFDPEERVRIEVLDCGDGYACLKSRWLDQDPSISGHFMSDRGSDGYDIDFQPETDPAESDYTKWRVFCTHDYEFNWCYICDYYFSWLYDMDNCLFGNQDLSLSTDFAITSGSPDNVYKFKIHIPTAQDDGVIIGGESECNAESSTIPVEVTYKVGVENILLQPWAYSETTRSEIKAAVNLDLPASSWELEELSEVTNTTVVVELLPQNKVVIEQPVARYGSAYRMYGALPAITQVPC